MLPSTFDISWILEMEHLPSASWTPIRSFTPCGNLSPLQDFMCEDFLWQEHIGSLYKTEKSSSILKYAGTSRSCVEIVPQEKQRSWRWFGNTRLTIKSQAPKWKNPSTIRCPWQTAFKCWNQSSEGDGENSKASPANPRRNRIAFECFGLSRVRCAS